MNELNINPVKIVEDKLGLKAAKLFVALLKQESQEADAIIFLQGDQLDRVKTVKLLYDNSSANHILITGNNELVGKGKRNEENDIHLRELKEWLVQHRVPESAIIMDNESFNTLDQAMHTITLAKTKGWLKIIVVTSPFHILRAYLTFVKQKMEQEWGGAIIMRTADLSWNAIPSGRIKTGGELLAIEMEKIQKYSRDIATVENGIRQLE